MKNRPGSRALAGSLFALVLLAGPILGADAVNTILAREDLASYRGWIKYLTFLADDARARHGADSEPALAAASRRDDWAQRIVADPDLLAKLRGVQEWAYESPVDGSGQPFKIMIPTDYDPDRPAPLSVTMHGYSGNHLEHSTGMTDRPGAFEVAVLGRSRGSYYTGLGEADILHVIDYVHSHWVIHRDRVHLAGGSMGGGATFRFGARHPHLFASGRPTCGFAIDMPPGNLLTFPLYATHSDDDWVVPVLLARGPLERVRALGGSAILDETTGLGHAAWDFAEGNARAAVWALGQQRPPSRSQFHLDYTALDGNATRAWWARILEWGDEPRPARFVLRVGGDNTLHATLTNISRLWVMVAGSPLDPERPLQVSINGRPVAVIPAPLPGGLELRHPDIPPVSAGLVEKPGWRLHTPGGPIQLYNGEPLLIVYGTRGDEATRAAMRVAALAASRSSNSGWPADGSEAAPDGVPHSHLLYGHLPVKTDVDVTDADLTRCHLVLVGTAEQNALVARLADRLPVRLANGAITCNDGFALPADGRALSLVHYNPLAPSRLIHWVASTDARAYAAETPVVKLTRAVPHGRTYVGSDLVIAHATEMTVVAARSFDRAWRWVPGRETSPVLGEDLRTHRALGAAIAECVRREAGADFALATLASDEAASAIVPGTTRVADLLPLHYFDFICVAELSGSELLALTTALDTTNDPWSDDGWARMHPRPDSATVRPDQRYRVAMASPQVWTFGRVGKIAPRSFRQTDLQVCDAIAHWLGR